MRYVIYGMEAGYFFDGDKWRNKIYDPFMAKIYANREEVLKVAEEETGACAILSLEIKVGE